MCSMLEVVYGVIFGEFIVEFGGVCIVDFSDGGCFFVCGLLCEDEELVVCFYFLVDDIEVVVKVVEEVGG